MRILSRLLYALGYVEKRASMSDPRFWMAEQLTGGMTRAGVYVSPDRAMTISAVYACVRVIAESVAQLPLILYKRTPSGKKPAPEHPKYILMHDRPNAEQTPFEFREMFTGHAALRGNAYGGKEYTSDGLIEAVIPMNPARMEVKREKSGEIVYIYTDDTGKQAQYTADQIWHFKGLSNDGITGLSPVQLFRESLGLTKSAEEYAAQYFGNNATPGSILKHPGQLKTTAKENLKQSLDAYAADRRHKTLVLEEGMEWQTIGLSNKDSQFLESRSFQIEEICRMWNVPAILIHHPDKAATYASAEQFALNFVKYCILPWCKRFEQSANRALLTGKEQEKYFYEFKLDSLLRGDTQSRYTAYASARQWGWMCVDDIRALENLEPLPDGKGQIFLQPSNMVEAGEEPEPIASDNNPQDKQPAKGENNKNE